MELVVIFHSERLKTSSKDPTEFFSKCFDSCVEEISKNTNSIFNPITEHYEEKSLGEAILRRNEILSLVKDRIVEILVDDWHNTLKYEELDKYNYDYNLKYFFNPYEIFEDPKSSSRSLKPNVKIISFKPQLSQIMIDFIHKTLE